MRSPRALQPGRGTALWELWQHTGTVTAKTRAPVSGGVQGGTLRLGWGLGGQGSGRPTFQSLGPIGQTSGSGGEGHGQLDNGPEHAGCLGHLLAVLGTRVLGRAGRA